MNVVELIALLDTVKDKSLEVIIVNDVDVVYYTQLPEDPVLDIYGGYVYIQEGE